MSKLKKIDVPGWFGGAGAPPTAARRGGAASRAEGARGGPPLSKLEICLFLLRQYGPLISSYCLTLEVKGNKGPCEIIIVMAVFP